MYLDSLHYSLIDSDADEAGHERDMQILEDEDFFEYALGLFACEFGSVVPELSRQVDQVAPPSIITAFCVQCEGCRIGISAKCQ